MSIQITNPTVAPRLDRGFLRDVHAGLSRTSKTLPCKYFYDARGSALFDQICELPEYYPTRTELAILRNHVGEITRHLGRDCTLIEYGSGSSLKTRLLLAQLSGGVYHPVDISREHLLASARTLAAEFPTLLVDPICADFTRPFTVPHRPKTGRKVVYFSGSTIGNFPRPEALRLLHQISEQIAPGGGLLIGVDLRKDRATLEAAYNDAAGVTAAFNLNLLVRINRELSGTFDLDRFRHRAVYHEAAGRIEMYLISLDDQVVEVDGEEFAFEAGERICTEYSCKYTREEFAEMLREAGLEVRQVWTDPQQLFSVQYASLTRAV
ncbi:MAG: L-histidine N(alpha)-methyltransferase [Gemmataceae bacterium]